MPQNGYRAKKQINKFKQKSNSVLETTSRLRRNFMEKMIIDLVNRFGYIVKTAQNESDHLKQVQYYLCFAENSVQHQGKSYSYSQYLKEKNGDYIARKEKQNPIHQAFFMEVHRRSPSRIHRRHHRMACGGGDTRQPQDGIAGR
jgi:hypothetical protein